MDTASFFNQALLLRGYAAACPAGRDAYTFAAAQLLGIHEEQVSSEQRAASKRLCALLNRNDLPASLPNAATLVCAAGCGSTPHQWHNKPLKIAGWYCVVCGACTRHN